MATSGPSAWWHVILVGTGTAPQKPNRHFIVAALPHSFALYDGHRGTGAAVASFFSGKLQRAMRTWEQQSRCCSSASVRRVTYVLGGADVHVSCAVASAISRYSCAVHM